MKRVWNEEKDNLLRRHYPRVACEVMAGHGRVDVQIETSLGRMDLRAEDIDPLIRRLFGERVVGNVLIAPQVLSPLWQGGGYKAGVEMRLAA